MKESHKSSPESRIEDPGREGGGELVYGREAFRVVKVVLRLLLKER